MIEEWKDIVGYENYFEVSSFGNIKRKGSNRNLKLQISKKGYALLPTRISGRKGKSLCFRVHREVAKAFIPNPENKPQVNHLDCNKTNNFVSNLEWSSQEENISHAQRNKLFVTKMGSDNHMAKLSKDQVLEIRKIYKPFSKEFGARALAKRYGIHHTSISDVANRKTYFCY